MRTTTRAARPAACGGAGPQAGFHGDHRVLRRRIEVGAAALTAKSGGSARGSGGIGSGIVAYRARRGFRNAQQRALVLGIDAVRDPQQGQFRVAAGTPRWSSLQAPWSRPTDRNPSAASPAEPQGRITPGAEKFTLNARGAQGRRHRGGWWKPSASGVKGSRMPPCDPPHLLQRPFHRNRIGLDEQVAMQCGQRGVDRRRRPRIAPQRRLAHVGASRRARRWRSPRSHPRAPASIHSRAVASSPESSTEIIAAVRQHLARALESATASLMATICGCCDEASHGRWQHVHRGPRRHVVQDHRHARGVGYGLEVQEQPLLRGLVVVGRHDQDRVHAGFSVRPACTLDGHGGRCGARARDDWMRLPDRRRTARSTSSSQLDVGQ